MPQGKSQYADISRQKGLTQRFRSASSRPLFSAVVKASALQCKVLAVWPFGDIITVRALQSGVCGKLYKRFKIVPKGTVIAVKGLKIFDGAPTLTTHVDHPPVTQDTQTQSYSTNLRICGTWWLAHLPENERSWHK